MRTTTTENTMVLTRDLDWGTDDGWWDGTPTSTYLISTFEAEGITDIAEFEAHGQTIADFELNGWTG